MEAAVLFGQPPPEAESQLAGLESLAGVAAGQGLNARAARLFAAAQALRQNVGLPVMVWWRRSRARLIEAAREVLETSEYDGAREEGRTMSLEQAVEYALDQGQAPKGWKD
jgi:hypothetical protein